MIPCSVLRLLRLLATRVLFGMEPKHRAGLTPSIGGKSKLDGGSWLMAMVLHRARLRLMGFSIFVSKTWTSAAMRLSFEGKGNQERVTMSPETVKAIEQASRRIRRRFCTRMVRQIPEGPMKTSNGAPVSAPATKASLAAVADFTGTHSCR